MYSVGRSRMKEFLKKNWQISLVGLTTLLLAVIALVTAWRLYQVGKEPIAPTAPTSFPQAVGSEEPEVGVCTLEFTITASPPPVSCYDACEDDNDCPQDFGDDEIALVCDEDDNICVNEDCPDEDDCECPEESPTPTPTPTPTPKPTPSPSPSPSIAGSPVPSPSLEPSPSPQQVELPEAGIISPTILATLGGIILVLIGLLL